MANLNLSQFGENTSVSNADYTFVWDSANAISKKVSRNSWLNSGTLTSDAPVTISQTWNAGSNAMTALKVVATDTASGATSNLLELWAGSTPVLDFAVTKTGVMQAYGTYSTAGANYARLALACDSSGNATISTQALGTGTAGVLAFSPGNSERMRITTAGNVGIGTTAPGAKLEVAGTIHASGWTGVQRIGGSSQGGYMYARGALEGSNFGNPLGNGVVEISTNAPGLVIGVTGAASMVLGTNQLERVRILSTGEVGIGTTSPTSKLQVTGGDVEIETVTRGIIMKAAGTSTRYRITLNATGDALVFTAI